ncbi:MAG: UDP-glucose 4-epimerase [Candidatus Blackburnbacteria bacterium RIFCSPLOWO2_01_FULL_41_27]|uniref:UDP-glucose 4-epimerase n=1 Tax=Candidatus Blackburnbacteria bacterium RIFCSPLOWO2_01_FULL_41_27 TaxID=1797520 RepID=A0A1G1VHZ4_9BACT|nr:MAG: UDP-glucose 4-epimerase [Candidatus Blackburnbacteria bacterium RIFCSPLOWO2_01_FULL_41_27]
MNNSYSQYEKDIRGKVILVTGGTGSFGNAVISGLLQFDPKRIIVFSRDEKKQHDMRYLYNSPILKFVIGDVRDAESINKVMGGVNYVFHAAALKQVPSCEFFPLEAIKTNILGAHNVIDAAIQHKVERLVVLSTDKAVYPINAMGLTKALMEKVMIANSRKISEPNSGLSEENNGQTTLCGTRYGNVLMTRGSVIPYFIELIKKGEVLTVTDPNMTRFLLPLSESVELVLHAMTNGKNGDIYVKKAPATNMETLVQAVCKIFNYDKGHKVVGIRAGEKIHETLISQEEMARAEDEGDYFRIPSESQGLDYQQYYDKGKRSPLEEVISFTSENTKQLDLEQTTDLLMTLPEIQEELRNFKK